MAKFAVIVAAAGRSSRFGGQAAQKKPFVALRGRPVWLHAVEPFVSHIDVAQVVVVVSPDDLDWFQEQFRSELTTMNIQVVPGGQERADSVQNALAVLWPEIEFVAVHDAARPLVTRRGIERVFQAARTTGAAIPAAPIASTVKRAAAGIIAETIPREGLWAAQTPQVFRKQLLMEAYASWGDVVATDEAQLVERTGHPVAIVESSAINLKITSQEDFRIADALLDLLSDDTDEL